jgi:hypothetical protein
MGKEKKQGAAKKQGRGKGKKVPSQCFKKCPNHSTGACYLDFGHSGDHKCSYGQENFVASA